MSGYNRRWGRLAGLSVAGVLLFYAAAAWAQAKKKPTIPKPENHTVDSVGVTIHFTYYPGGVIQKSEAEFEARPGKEVVPIILLHGYEGRGLDFNPLPYVLQRTGYAVVVPDLRGHGASRYKSPGKGEDVPADKLGRQDFAAMVNDLELIKKFLYDKNNQGLLNMESLCLIGADLGGLVATNWIAADWSRQDLPAFRQGKSAKGLIILSPISSVKGYNASAAWKQPIPFQYSALMSIMLVAGTRDSDSFREAKQIHKRLENSHRFDASAGDRSKQSLWLIEPETDLRGANLVNPKFRLNVAQQIGQFLALRLASRQAEFTWSERKSPLGN